MRVWGYEKQVWPCVACEDERELYEGRPLVAVFDTLDEALPVVEMMLTKARAARRSGQAADLNA